MASRSNNQVLNILKLLLILWNTVILINSCIRGCLRLHWLELAKLSVALLSLELCIASLGKSSLWNAIDIRLLETSISIKPVNHRLSMPCCCCCCYHRRGRQLVLVSRHVLYKAPAFTQDLAPFWRHFIEVRWQAFASGDCIHSKVTPTFCKTWIDASILWCTSEINAPIHTEDVNAPRCCRTVERCERNANSPPGLFTFDGVYEPVFVMKVNFCQCLACCLSPVQSHKW